MFNVESIRITDTFTAIDLDLILSDGNRGQSVVISSFTPNISILRSFYQRIGQHAVIVKIAVDEHNILALYLPNYTAAVRLDISQLEHFSLVHNYVEMGAGKTATYRSKRGEPLGTLLIKP